MLKITKALLEAKFPALNINSLMEIVAATPNPEVATEILCGLYEEPIVPNKVENRDGVVYTLNSYDKWQNRVNYSYERKITKGAYFPEGTKVSDVTMENFDTLKVSSGNNYLHVPTGKTEIATSYEDLSRWLSYKISE